MGTKVNYTVVGIFVVVLGSILVMITLWLTAGHRAKNFNTYLVYMNEAVAGLSEQAPVKFNGVKVGYVKSIKLNPNNLQQVILTLEIESNVPITTSTTATLMAQGITGLTYVGLKAKTAKAPLLIATAGQPFPVIKSEPSFLVQLDTAVREITTNITNLSESVRQVFDVQNREAISKTLQNIDKFSQTFAENSSEINASLKNANTILKNTAKASKDLPQVLKEFKATLTSIKNTTQRINEVGVQARLTLQDSHVAVQSFSQQTLPNINQLLTQLGNLTNNLDGLSEKLNQNPSVLIRGELPPPPGPGE